MSALAFNNSRVQQLRRLIGRRSSRYDEGLFVVEGHGLIAEAVAAGWGFEAQFVPEGSDAGVAGAGSVFELVDGVFERVAATDAPRPPIAVVRMAERDVTETLAVARFVVVLDQVADPGNLGTIIRSAEAAGVDAVALTPGSADPYSPKVVRSSAGALFHVPVVVATLDVVAGSGIEMVGTSSHGFAGRTILPYTGADLTGRVGIVMGNEAAGLPDSWTDDAGPIRRWVTIPHQGRSESLNVAMATTVLVFEAARQRTDQSQGRAGVQRDVRSTTRN